MSNSSDFLEKARRWCRRLLQAEATRGGVSLAVARSAVARRSGVPEGTLITLEAGRLKSIAAHVYDRLRSAVAAELAAEIGRLEHELQIIRATGLDPRGSEISEVEAHLAAARRALGKED